MFNEGCSAHPPAPERCCPSLSGEEGELPGRQRQVPLPCCAAGESGGGWWGPCLCVRGGGGYLFIYCSWWLQLADLGRSRRHCQKDYCQGRGGGVGGKREETPRLPRKRSEADLFLPPWLLPPGDAPRLRGARLSSAAQPVPPPSVLLLLPIQQHASLSAETGRCHLQPCHATAAPVPGLGAAGLGLAAGQLPGGGRAAPQRHHADLHHGLDAAQPVRGGPEEQDRPGSAARRAAGHGSDPQRVPAQPLFPGPAALRHGGRDRRGPRAAGRRGRRRRPVPGRCGYRGARAARTPGPGLRLPAGPYAPPPNRLARPTPQAAGRCAGTGGRGGGRGAGGPYPWPPSIIRSGCPGRWGSPRRPRSAPVRESPAARGWAHDGCPGGGGARRWLGSAALGTHAHRWEASCLAQRSRGRIPVPAATRSATDVRRALRSPAPPTGSRCQPGLSHAAAGRGGQRSQP